MIDDDPRARELLLRGLEREGYSVATAADGRNGIELARALRPALVTLDIIMPKMDGVAALKRVKETDPEAKVIMITAVDQREKLSECIARGAVDFIVKPFDAERLRKALGKYL